MTKFDVFTTLYEACGHSKENLRKLVCEAVYNSCLAEGHKISLEEIYALYDKIEEKNRNGSWKNYKTKAVE